MAKGKGKAKAKAKKRPARKARSQGRPDKGGGSVGLCKGPDYLSLDELRHHPKRLRVLDDKGFADLRKSLLDNGLYRPLLVWREGKKKGAVVLGGNQKLKVMRHLRDNEGFLLAGPGGDNNIPVVFFEGTPEQAELVVLRDNLHSGDWDYMNLGEHLADLMDQDIDPILAGFDRTEVDDLVELYTKGVDGEEGDEEEEEEPSLGQLKTYRFKVPRGELEEMVDEVIKGLGCEHDEALVRLARIALEHGGS